MVLFFLNCFRKSDRVLRVVRETSGLRAVALSLLASGSRRPRTFLLVVLVHEEILGTTFLR